MPRLLANDNISQREWVMTSIDGAVVLVTGGRRGLGAALVDEVLARGARAVHSTARSAFDDPRPAVTTSVLEVGSQDSVDALAAIAGDVDIVINNAGVLLPAPLLTGDLTDVVNTFEVNAFGPLRVVRAFAPILAANGGGAVVNVHSVLSWLGGSGAYGASKAALWSITNSLRTELAEQNTHVLGVHAGFIDTEMVSDIGLPKTSPAVIAARILDGLEAGEVEVLADDTTVAVKAMLAGPVENLTFTSAH
ncbi:SDR family oxidoreductase [Williamsia maris]|uniref:Short-chain dehydrogenase n=2 Tax=Williamsia maris TaxID=72806 RepID=A0ABT1HHW6_9NOCA|nr:Short-chain dehydrogenase [Williamsia maris]